LNSHAIGLLHQHGRCFIVLEHQYSCHELMCIRSILGICHSQYFNHYFVIVTMKTVSSKAIMIQQATILECKMAGEFIWKIVFDSLTFYSEHPITGDSLPHYNLSTVNRPITCTDLILERSNNSVHQITYSVFQIALMIVTKPIHQILIVVTNSKFTLSAHVQDIKLLNIISLFVVKREWQES